MADSRLRARRGLRRSGRYPARIAAKAVSDSGKEKSGRSTLVKQRPAVFPDLSNDTPRVMLKRIIRTQPQVSPLAPQISTYEETEEARSELPSKRISSTVEMQLPDLVPEHTSIATFHMTKKRKKLSISEFERAADKRLPQNQAQSTLDSTALARSLRMSLGSLIAPDTVEKRGLLRRPKSHKAIDMEAFEGGVEQNMLKRKAEDYLVDSHTASGIQTAPLTSDAEIMLNNTELFVQPRFDEQSQNKLSALEPQLLDSKTSAQRSKISDAAQEEAGLVGLVSSVGTKEGRTQRYSEDLILDREHVDGITHLSPKTPTNQREDKQDHSRRSNPVEQLSVPEEVVVGTAEHHANAGYSEHLEKKLTKKAELQIATAQNARVETETAPSEEGVAEGIVEHQGSPEAEHEIVEGVGAGSLGRRSHAFSSSEKSGMKPLKEAVEQADELEDQAIMVEFDSPGEVPTEDEAEDAESEEVSMKTPTFVRAAAYKLPLSTPHLAKPAAPNFPPRSPLQPLRAKPVPKSSRASRRKTCEPAVASSLIKKVFSHYVKMPVSREAFKIVEKCSEKYFKQLSSDLEAYSSHARRKTVEMADLELLMRRQGLVTDKMPLHVLIERYLPLEYRKLLIPVAVSGNKVIPCK
ncbi:centromere protein T isoform X4 [Balearica regulorum gibbericeps]|uniref:centromere protein T isoform X4 n=1 Tax=Balearica regulorum gibbericeps TaxID=100784 RepID=UPI003F5FC915